MSRLGKTFLRLLSLFLLLPMVTLRGQSPQPILTLPAGSNDAACSAAVTKACTKEFVVKVNGAEKGRIAYAQGTLTYPIPGAMLTGLAAGTSIAVDVVYLDEYGVQKQVAYKTLTVPAPYVPSFLTGGNLAWGQSTTASGGTVSGTAGGGSGAPAVTITPNPPTTSNGIGSITTTSAIITVGTNVLAKCRLRYGTSTGVYGTTQSYESSQATSHPLTFTAALTANTQYFGVVDCSPDGIISPTTTLEWNFTTQASGATDPLYGSSSTAALVPGNKYYAEIASINCAAGTCTVDVTATFTPHGFNVNDRIKLYVPSDASACPTTGAGVVHTVATAPDTDTFTFSLASCTYSSSAAGAYVMWMPAWNDGDVYTATPGSTPVRRLCNFELTGSYRVAYSPWYGVSPDGTMLVVLKVGGGVAVLNVASCTFVRTNTEAAAQQLSNENDNPRWLNAGSSACPGANPCLIWFKFNSGQVRVWDVVNSASSTLHDTITGCGSGLSLGRTGELDTTANLVAIRCDTGSGFEWFTYTISSKTKGAVYSSTNGGDFNQVVDGGNFTIFWGTTGTGNENGVQLYDGTTGARIRQISTISSHGTVRGFSDGNSYLVAFDGGATECANSSLFAKRVTDLAKTCLFVGANPSTDRTLGISDPNGAHPNFILFSYLGQGSNPVLVLDNTWKTNWTQPYQAEVGLIKWVPPATSITNFRLAHHWQRIASAAAGYNGYPHATMNRNATVIVFNSWGTCGSTPTACTPKGTIGSASYVMGFGVMKPFDAGNP